MHSFDHPWKCHSAKFEGCAFIFKARLHFISYRTIFLWYQKELKVKWGRSIDETRLSCYLNESIWKDWVFVREKFYWQRKISYRRGNLLALFSWRCLSYETLIKNINATEDCELSITIFVVPSFILFKSLLDCLRFSTMA